MEPLRLVGFISTIGLSNIVLVKSETLIQEVFTNASDIVNEATDLQSLPSSLDVMEREGKRRKYHPRPRDDRRDFDYALRDPKQDRSGYGYDDHYGYDDDHYGHYDHYETYGSYRGNSYKDNDDDDDNTPATPATELQMVTKFLYKHCNCL